ncbi:MAG TPA: SGNH/GDSL hydrolase family protein [Bryobacteraceae bacterium]|jgi:lysophospholipase L1-like esterase|nr:SGNH/GDSL hydrolase family protein [Bryobacteraceae bacterium]
MRSLGAVLLCFLFARHLTAQSDFYLKDGDTVVFYGDSITDQRLYTTFTEAYVVTRFPNLNIRFVHSGWSGDRVDGGAGGPIDTRLTRDVLAYQPTVVTLMLGMNDAGYRLFDDTLFKTYRVGYEHIVRALKTAAPKVRLTAIQPSPYDDITRAPLFEGGYNNVLISYGKFVRELARREGLLYADLNTSVVAALRTANQADPALAQKLIPDRVHPSAPIHFLMAEALLKAWNAPAVVSDVEIDAALPAARKTINTSISELSDDGGIAWTQVDNSLPMPIETFPSEDLLQLALRSSDFMDALNRETLTVTGLTPGRAYTLKIDGQAIVSHSAGQWSAGVNLGPEITPMSKQAIEVLQLIYRHNNLHWARWHMIQTSFETEPPPSMDRAMASLDTLDREVAAMARAKAQPKPHRYELTAVE